MYIYPNTIGRHISKQAIDDTQLKALKTRLDNQTIIRVYGLSGVGKGTLGSYLSNKLSLINVDTGTVWRAVTYVAHEKNWIASDEHIKHALSLLTPLTIQNQMKLMYENQILSNAQLRNHVIDSHVTQFSTLSVHGRELFSDFLLTYLTSDLKHPTLNDGRGANEGYIMHAEKLGYKVIRILLTSTLEMKIERRYKEYVAHQKTVDPDIESKPDKLTELHEKCVKGIVIRDEKDVQNIEEKNLTLISDESGVIDTTNMSIEEVGQTALWFIYHEIFGVDTDLV